MQILDLFVSWTGLLGGDILFVGLTAWMSTTFKSGISVVLGLGAKWYNKHLFQALASRSDSWKIALLLEPFIWSNVSSVKLLYGDACGSTEKLQELQEVIFSIVD